MKEIIDLSHDEEKIIKSLENIDFSLYGEDEILSQSKEIIYKKYYSLYLILLEKVDFIINKHYYDFTYYKIFSLKELKKYTNAYELLIEELKMPYIPSPFDEKFEELLKEIGFKIKSSKKETILSNEEVGQILLRSEVKEDILRAIDALTYKNIRKLFFYIETFFAKKNIKNIYKLMIVDIMNDQGVDKNFKIENKKGFYKINPINYKDVLKLKSYKNILEKIEVKYGSQSQQMYDKGKETIFLYLVYIWPKDIEEKDYDLVFKAIDVYINNLFGLESRQIEKKAKKIIEDIKNASDV